MAPNNSWTSSPSATLLSTASSSLKSASIKHLMENRQNLFFTSFSGIHLDFSRQLLDDEAFHLLTKFAEEQQLSDKIRRMFEGEIVNTTEKRAALHIALRCPEIKSIVVDGVDVVKDVHRVLMHIKQFSEDVRSGKFLGYTGKPLKNLICVGIGGSYLGTEFVAEALSMYADAKTASEGRTLRFLANVDPIDFKRATDGLDPSTTLIIIISKTFTTAETILNAKLMKQWILDSMIDKEAVGYHMVAVSSNISLAAAFGINPKNVFGFWDWVGGRFSVTSAVGALPLALQFGWPIVEQFLNGCHAMDEHFRCTPFDSNMAVVMALIALWNSSFLEFNTVAILPYCQALHRFPAHLQQLAMESNGKGVSISGNYLTQQAGEIYFGEPGTNGQHSFYQLLHQGRIVPSEFIGFCQSPTPASVAGECVSCHDELMSNFFAQPDALAFGKSELECINEGTDLTMAPHKTFPGNRPSMMLLLPEVSPYYLGCLLALYEHRIVTQAFLWGINPFDQWGVELGKKAAKEVRSYLQKNRQQTSSDSEALFCASTKRMLHYYLNPAGASP